VKKKMKIKQSLRKLLKQNRGMVGIEAAIVLIAFVIVAAAFSFMVVNMGLFATQKGKTTISQGVTQTSSPLILDGDIMVHGTPATATPFAVDAFVIPLETIGVNYVPMDQNSTEVGLRVGTHTAIADCYLGVEPSATTNPTNSTLDTLVTATNDTTVTNSVSKLFVGNSNDNTSLDFNEKGYLVVTLTPTDEAFQGEHVYIQIRPQTGAPLSIDFVVPAQLASGWATIGQ
jgi:flagellin FlaB